MIGFLPLCERLALQHHIHLLFELVDVRNALQCVVRLLILRALAVRIIGWLAIGSAILLIDVHLEDLLLDGLAQLLIANDHVSRGSSNC